MEIRITNIISQGSVLRHKSKYKTNSVGLIEEMESIFCSIIDKNDPGRMTVTNRYQVDLSSSLIFFKIHIIVVNRESSNDKTNSAIQGIRQYRLSH